jgi:hypothetical protein
MDAREFARQKDSLFNIALDTVTLGRSHFALALQLRLSWTSVAAARSEAGTGATELESAVNTLRSSSDHSQIPRGDIARAAFRRSIGDWDGAARDLDEVQEIAEPGPMRLYLCAIALERARLALARREAFAPLNGLVEAAPPPPAPPDAAAAAALRGAASEQLDIARELIADCGYHRRDEELRELDDVAAGRRRFADLPPRVRGSLKTEPLSPECDFSLRKSESVLSCLDPRPKPSRGCEGQGRERSGGKKFLP